MIRRPQEHRQLYPCIDMMYVRTHHKAFINDCTYARTACEHELSVRRCRHAIGKGTWSGYGMYKGMGKGMVRRCGYAIGKGTWS